MLPPLTAMDKLWEDTRLRYIKNQPGDVGMME